jgi:hypothetical protein
MYRPCAFPKYLDMSPGDSPFFITMWFK